MKDEILEYIRKHVTEWPKGAESVWLDADDEIRFNDTAFDFYPSEAFNPSGISKCYNREQWQPEITLEELDKPFGELDRKTQLRLVEHVIDGGSVEYYARNEMNTQVLVYDGIAFNKAVTYRAKLSRKDEIARQIKALQDELSVLQANP